MKTLFFRTQKEILRDIYSLQNEDAKGRLISLGSALMTSFYNVFITGIFYNCFFSFSLFFRII